MEWRGREWSGVEGREGEGRAGQGRVPDCLGGLSRVGISSRSTRPWNGQPPSIFKVVYNISRVHNRLHIYPLCWIFFTSSSWYRHGQSGVKEMATNFQNNRDRYGT